MNKFFLFFKPIYSEKIVKFFFVPTLLFAFWIVLSILLVYPPSFSVVSKYNDKYQIENFSTKKILKGEKITGFIRASENNFGILIVRFNPAKPVLYKNEDIILFSIKEKGKNKFIAQNNYTSGAFTASPFFPFGFPPIENSKGKTYEFEIRSLRGDIQNAVSLSQGNPIIASQYKFSKVDVLSNGKSFFDLIFLKITTFLTDKDSILLSIPYLLPLAIYLFLLFFKKVGLAIFYIVLSFVLMDIFINFYVATTISPIGDAVLVFFWILSLRRYRLDESVSFFFSFVFFLTAVFGISLGQASLVQKSSDWSYYLLAIGIIQTSLFTKDNHSSFLSICSLFIKTFRYYEK